MEAPGSLLGTLVASGRIVDPILGLVAAEAALVALGVVRFGPRAPVLAGLAAGAGLLLALRAGLAGAPWPWIAGALALAGGAHLAELALRRTKTLRRREPSATSAEAAALGWVSRRVTRARAYMAQAYMAQAYVAQAFTAQPDPPPRPPPSAGEDGLRASGDRSGRRPAEGGAASPDGAEAFTPARPVAEPGFPSGGTSSRPAPFGGCPPPRKGEGRAGWPAGRVA